MLIAQHGTFSAANLGVALLVVRFHESQDDGREAYGESYPRQNRDRVCPMNTQKGYAAAVCCLEQVAAYHHTAPSREQGAERAPATSTSVNCPDRHDAGHYDIGGVCRQDKPCEHSDSLVRIVDVLGQFSIIKHKSSFVN